MAFVQKNTYAKAKRHAESLEEQLSEIAGDKKKLTARVEKLSSTQHELEAEIKELTKQLQASQARLVTAEQAYPSQVEELTAANRVLRERAEAAAARAAELSRQTAAAEAAAAAAATDSGSFVSQYLPDVFPRGSFAMLRPSRVTVPAPLPVLARLSNAMVVGHRPTGEVVLSFPELEAGNVVQIPHSSLRPLLRPGNQVRVRPSVAVPLNGWPHGVSHESVGEVINFEQHFASVFFPFTDASVEVSDGIVREFCVNELMPAVRGALYEGQVVRVAPDTLRNAEVANAYADFASKYGVVTSVADLDASYDATVTVDFFNQLEGTLAKRTATDAAQQAQASPVPARFGLAGVGGSRGYDAAAAAAPVGAAAGPSGGGLTAAAPAAGRYWDILADHMDTPFTPGTLVRLSPDIATTPGSAPITRDVPEIEPVDGRTVQYLRQPNDILAGEVGTVLGVEFGIVFVRFPSVPHIGVAASALEIVPNRACVERLRRGDIVTATTDARLPYYVPASSALVVDHVDPEHDVVEVIFALRAHDSGLCRWAFRSRQLCFLAQGPTARVVVGDYVRCGEDAIDGRVTAIRKTPDGNVAVSVRRDDTGSVEVFPLLVVALRARSVPRPLIPMFEKVMLRPGAPERYWPPALARETAGVLRGMNTAGYSCIEYDDAEAARAVSAAGDFGGAAGLDERAGSASFAWCRTKKILSARSGLQQSTLRSPIRHAPEADSASVAAATSAAGIEAATYGHTLDVARSPIPAMPIGFRIASPSPAPRLQPAEGGPAPGPAPIPTSPTARDTSGAPPALDDDMSDESLAPLPAQAQPSAPPTRAGTDISAANEGAEAAGSAASVPVFPGRYTGLGRFDASAEGADLEPAPPVAEPAVGPGQFKSPEATEDVTSRRPMVLSPGGDCPVRSDSPPHFDPPESPYPELTADDY